ncbi:MAG: site-specific integrase, partial [Nocardioidaceae bacterium]
MNAHPLRAVEDGRLAFGDDEPVLQQHPLRSGVPVPAFADPVWDLAAADSAANIPSHAKIIRFDRFGDAMWEGRARELLMARLNPNHPEVRAAGVHRSGTRGTAVRTVVELANALVLLARWAAETGRSADLTRWQRADSHAYLEVRRTESRLSPIGLVRSAVALRSLHTYRMLLTGGGLAEDPFDDLPLPTVVGYQPRESCTGSLVSRDVFWPLLRAAWAYLDRFSDDILTARDEWAALLARSGSGLPTGEVLARWARDPDATVCVHSGEGREPAGAPNWRLLSLQLGLPEHRLGQGQGATVRAIRARADALVEQRRIIVGGLAEPLVTVHRPDGTTGPWRNGLDPAALTVELNALRTAAYLFIAALSGMRDSEIQELRRGCIEEWHGGLVLRSRQHKHRDGREQRWAVIDPVGRAVEVLQRLSWHDTHLFVPLTANRAASRSGRTPRGTGIDANTCIETFIRHVNTTAGCTGLDSIPAEPVTTHMFRHTFAAIAADEPFAEIAVGWQLKHAANRIHTTQAHLDRTGTGWGDDLASEQTRAAIDTLYESLVGYLDGAPVAGPGGARRKAFYDAVAAEAADRFPGQLGEDELIKPLLRSAAENFYPGTLNDCAFDASLALCLQDAVDPNRSQPVLSACQPSRCPNATIEARHRPVWVAARGR